ncbi:MAG: TetR/AcrR family transcriptional regulator [Acidimicrobiia bacterium]|nr:TetR/AcrR family transcriptional regulator [Acidimicrobiia bacterium]MDH5420208.1 TetR/AcrR family transcriptional regulator [Acidimicrobiia bacterium]
MSTTEQPRREMILDAAVALFRTQGFHGAGIDDIGAAAGISGPGVYRHFENKHALLVAMSERVVERLLAHNERVAREEVNPMTALERLVKTHASFVFSSRELITVYVIEERNLPEPDRLRVSKKQREYVEGWVRFLTQLAPDGDPSLLKGVAIAVIGMINTAGHPDSKDQNRNVVEQMAMASLMAGALAVSRNTEGKPRSGASD